MADKLRFSLQQISFGKEYEMSERFLPFQVEYEGKRLNDGSGPTEFNIPPSYQPKRAIYFEYLLYRFYGEMVYNYYVSKGGDEQKGCHFHIRLNYVSNRHFWRFYVLYSVFGYAFRKFYTKYNYFRNSFLQWNERIAYYVKPDDLIYFDGRTYSMFTPNRNRKSVLTVEVRASEYSIVCDLVNIALAMFFMNKITATDRQLHTVLKYLSEIQPRNDVQYTTYIHRSWLDSLKPYISVQSLVLETTKILSVSLKPIHNYADEVRQYLGKYKGWKFLGMFIEQYAVENWSREVLTHKVLEYVAKTLDPKSKSAVLKAFLNTILDDETTITKFSRKYL